MLLWRDLCEAGMAVYNKKALRMVSLQGLNARMGRVGSLKAVSFENDIDA